MNRSKLLLLLLSSLFPWLAAAEPGLDLQRLAWLEGIWTGTTEGIAMEEHWTSPSGGSLLGMHKDVEGGRTVSFEFFRIITTDSNQVCYLTSPNGAPPTSFGAIELTDSRVVFENRTHDFPQRILYWLDAQGRLHARIEGEVGGALRSQEWAWTRASTARPTASRNHR